MKEHDLPARVLAMCKARGFGLDWHERVSVLALESAELGEAYRGKRGKVLEEAADVLIATAAIVGAAGVSWADVLKFADEKVDWMTKDKICDLCAGTGLLGEIVDSKGCIGFEDRSCPDCDGTGERR